MFWVLQRGLFNPSAFEGLVDQLVRQGVEHAVVEIKAGKMIPDVETQGPVMAMGALAMGEIAKAKGWIPGRFEENLDCGVWLERYGDMMFNAGGTVEKLGAAQARSGEFFIRPAMDSKAFTGMVVDDQGFEDLKARLASRLGVEGASELRIFHAPLREIKAEWRFFVVDDEPVTGCLYKMGRTALYSDQVDARAWDAARAACARFNPSRAYALDLAEDAERGVKVLEVNSVNSAGFYALDMGKFVAAVEALDFGAAPSAGAAGKARSPK